MKTISLALWLNKTLILSAANPTLLSSKLSPLWLSKEDIVVARPTPKGILLEAQKEGILHLYSASSTDKARVAVLSDANYAAIKKCPKAPVEIADDGLIWKGSTEELKNYTHCNFDKILPESASKIEKLSMEKEAELIKSGIRILRSEWTKGQRRLLIASNKNDEPELKQNIQKHLKELQPFYEIQFKDLPKPGNTIVFELTLFEFSRSKARELGLKWPSQFQMSALAGSPLPNLNGPHSLDLIANFGEQHGVGKILAQPRLRATPGETARFQSGGELPIVQSSMYGQKTQWKNYGLLLELTAAKETEAGNPEVSVEFSLELSEPDEGTALNGVPGMLKRSLQSRFELRAGETTILSSLVKLRNGKNREGLIGLSQIPFLSYIFSSENTRSQNTELWFAITPKWERFDLPNWQDEKYDLEL